jgi:FemAB-related protein (PEP-CTERM system-associated)
MITVSEFQGDAAEWDGYVNAHPDGLNYHQHGWMKVIRESFGHETTGLMARDGNGTVRGVLPLVRMKSRLFGNFIVSVPFVNYGGLLTDSTEAATALLAAAVDLRDRGGARHVEFRHLREEALPLACKRHKVTMLLPLADDPEEQWQGFNAKLRNQVRKAEKSGLTARLGGLELLDDFYEVFVRNMRDLGTPVYGRCFFERVLTIFPDKTRIIGIYLEKQVVAAGIASWYRDTLEVPWASSNKDYKTLCPNNLLYWEAIRFAIQEGFRTFDFGRSTPGEGTYKFKEQWGAQPHSLFWQYALRPGESLPELNPDNPNYALAIRVWQRLPLWFTRLIGPSIVRNIP